MAAIATMQAHNSSFTLAGVTVVDPRDGSEAPDMDVSVRAGLIETIARATGGTGPNRIDAVGKYLVPGFLDMHAHALNADDPSGALQLMVAKGITGFRQMSGQDRLLAARAQGTLDHGDISPELVELPGEVLSPGNGASIQQATSTLRQQVAAGADFIKVAAVSAPVFSAVQKEARSAGTTVSGHLPLAIDPIAASRDGIRSIEHLGPGIVMLAACSTDETAIRAELAQLPELKVPPVRLPFMGRILGAILARIVVNPVQRSSARSIALLQHAIDTFDETKARSLAEVFASDGTWHTPTLIRQLTTEECDLERFPNDADLRYVAAATLRLWGRTRSSFIKKFSAAERATLHATYDLQLRLLKIFDEAGVGILAGTDATGGVWLVPGPSLHHEFDELRRAGLSPLRVLQSTTSSAAEFLGRTATHGTVEAGKAADLVLLDANPLETVDALHAIAGVVLRGRYLSRSDLDGLQENVARAKSIT